MTATLRAPTLTLSEGALEGDGLVRLSTAVHSYLAAKRGEVAPDTRRHRASTLLRFTDTLGDPLVRRVTRHHVETWQAGLTVGPATARVHLSTVRVFCAWCIAHGYMHTDPSLGVKGPRQPQAMPRELSTDDVAKLFRALPDVRAELIVTLALAQGMRRGEIARQLREDIDWSGRMMLVHGKGSKDRWLPVNDETHEAILAYYRESLGATGPLVRSYIRPHRGVTPHTIGMLLAQWMSDAGVKNQPWDGKSGHALRHTRAGTLLDDDVDVREVQAILGHDSLSTTQIYLRRRHADGALRDAMNRRRFRT